MRRNHRRRLAGGMLVLLLGGISHLALERREFRRIELEQARASIQEGIRRQEVRAEGIPVLVVRQDVEAGTTLEEALIEEVLLPRTQVPWSDDPELEGQYPGRAAAEGRIALTRLGAREPLRSERLALPQDLRTVSHQIHPGKRAVTIPVDLERSVGGFVRQGDFVDVLAGFTLPGGIKLSKPILQRVRLLIVDRVFEKAPSEVPPGSTRAHSEMSMVTFEVRPAEAEKLLLAAWRMPLTLALRHPEDQGVNQGDLVATDETVFPVSEENGSEAVHSVSGVELILGDRKLRRERG